MTQLPVESELPIPQPIVSEELISGRAEWDFDLSSLACLLRASQQLAQLAQRLALELASSLGWVRAFNE